MTSLYNEFRALRPIKRRAFAMEYIEYYRDQLEDEEKAFLDHILGDDLEPKYLQNYTFRNMFRILRDIDNTTDNYKPLAIRYASYLGQHPFININAFTGNFRIFIINKLGEIDHLFNSLNMLRLSAILLSPAEASLLVDIIRYATEQFKTNYPDSEDMRPNPYDHLTNIDRIILKLENEYLSANDKLDRIGRLAYYPDYRDYTNAIVDEYFKQLERPQLRPRRNSRTSRRRSS